MCFSIIYPASAFCFQTCSRNGCCLDLKVAIYNLYLIVAVYFILSSQYICVGSDCFSLIRSYICYLAKITCCHKLAYGSGKYRISLIKIFPAVIHSNRDRFNGNLNVYIFCCKIRIAGSGCFYTNCFHAFFHISYAWRFRCPVPFTYLIVYGVTIGTADFCFRRMSFSIVYPASAICIQLSTRYACCLDLEISFYNLYVIVAIQRIVSC